MISTDRTTPRPSATWPTPPRVAATPPGSRTDQVTISRPEPNSGPSIQSLLGGLKDSFGAATVPASTSPRQREIDRIDAIKDPYRRNIEITKNYHRLSRDMDKVLGPGAGANWATWGKFASNDVGRNLWALKPRTPITIGGSAEIALRGTDLPKTDAPFVGRVRNALAEGNRRVHKDIAPHFARFIETFKDADKPDPARLREFNAGFKPGEKDLKEAFRAYHDAKYADPQARRELTLKANLLIGRHEQTLLQPQVGRIPGTGLATSNGAIKLRLPSGAVDTGKDVVPLKGAALENIRDIELKTLLRDLAPGVQGYKGSAANDWGRLQDRMRFISRLFLSRHMDPSLSQMPRLPRYMD